MFALTVLGSALGATPAAAQTYRSDFTCGCEPAFTIEKSQEIAGSRSGFTASRLKGAIGDTVDYEILVKNTGNVGLTFSEFTDPHCDEDTIAGGPGTSHVAAGKTTVYTCTHLLTAVGTYTNEATVTGTPIVGMPVTHTSNQVVVEVPLPSARPGRTPAPAPAFTMEKRQEIMGATSGFTASPLTAVIGQTVDYQVVVNNTGNEALTFSSFIDPHCDQGTIAGGPGETPVAPGSSTTYTCSHVLTSAGKYVNQAGVAGIAGHEPPLTETSNQVEVNVAAQAVLASCEASMPPFRGATGPKSRIFTVKVSSYGINHITFYLDGRKLKRLKQSQARGGKFAITIDPRKLSEGHHTLSIKGVRTDPGCGPIAQSSGFVRPFTSIRRPKFTG